MCAAARTAGPSNDRLASTRAVTRLIALISTRAVTRLLALAMIGWVLGTAAAALANAPPLEPSSATPSDIPPRFEVVPAPGWVADVAVPETAGVSDELLHDGVADLLTDTQVRIGDGPERTFSRYVSQVVEPSGVSSVGRIQVDFAATYQSLELHWIRLVRDGVVQERLDPAKVRILQQEEDIDLHMVHQGATALVLLDDVRVGDRVDYAFSIVGANPIFDGRYQDWLYLEWWYPFGRIHNRIVAPADRPLYVEAHNTDELPERRAIEGLDGWVEWVWQRDAVGAALSEDSTPTDHDPLAAHQVSEFAAWGEVARWASGVFDVAEDHGDAVRALAAKIRAANATPEERIIAALRFVQDDVRYLGLEIGVNAFRPHTPALTLERRFGDCKDKSSLLVALLAELGVEAHVALVHTELGPGIADLHPTASAFDHAIVRVTLDGRAYWLDPTASYERGPLEDEQWFDYGFALVVDSNGDALTVVEPHRTRLLPSRIVHTYSSVAYDEPMRLEVLSTYRGDRADSFRAWAASMATDSIERQYQNYYAREMKRIELAEPIHVADDEAANTIVVTEQYLVPGAWDWDEGKERWTAGFVARELRDELSTPDTVQREHPLAISHPVRTELSIRISSPERMSVQAVDERIEGPAFTLDYAVRTDDDTVVIDYTYATTADRVAPDEVGRYLEAVDDAWSVTEYWLGSSEPMGRSAGELGGDRSAEGLGWRGSVAAALVAVAFVFFALPAWLLHRGLRAIESGDLAAATQRLRMASRAAPARSVLARRCELALSVATGLWGRHDEALGTAARLTRLPATSPRARAVRAAAWAWRARLAALRDVDGARAFADHAVDLARELPGVHGWMARACALSTRASLRAQHGGAEQARRDLDEARAHRSDEGERTHGWDALFRIISSTERSSVVLAAAAGDAPAAIAESAAYAERAAATWPAGHPIVVDALLLHAEQLARAGDPVEARRGLDRIEAALGPRIDVESPLRRRAAELRETLAAQS